MELCLFAAQKRDPQGLALHFYKIDQPAGDTQGQEAFAARYVFFSKLNCCCEVFAVGNIAPLV